VPLLSRAAGNSKTYASLHKKSSPEKSNTGNENGLSEK
jgi:hypothetical protein